MATPSQQILAKYDRVEREADELGRLIGVRKLRISEQMKVAGMTPDLDGSESARDDQTGEIRDVPKRYLHLLAAAVCEVDGVAQPFPQSRRELDHVLDRLDTEGLAAAGRAILRFMAPDAGAGPTPPGDEAGSVAERAKK